MEQHILGLSGVKQSGKTTTSNFIHGYQMRYHDVIETFMMNEQGRVIVNAVEINDDGEEVQGVGEIDLERRDSAFTEFASAMIWPYVRSFSFADPLKIIAMQLFALTEEQCLGTDEDKNSPTNIKWKRMPGLEEKAKGFMSAREFLQYFGTNICRKIKDQVWVDLCMKQIIASGTQLAIVPDVRFENEVEAIQKAGGKVIRLTRKPHEDAHPSETALDSYENFDVVIDNQNFDINETNIKVMEVLREWGWLKKKDS